MISLSLMVVRNKREEQILKMAFEQTGIKVLPGKSGYANFIKMLQYTPDLVLIELPRVHLEQLRFAEQIRSHKKTKRVPIIAYGDPIDEATKRGVLKRGVTTYMARPLKFSLLLSVMKNLLKKFNKSLDEAQPLTDKEKDIERLLHNETLPTQKIEIMSSHVSKMLAFPFTVAKSLQITQSEKTGAGDLARAMEADPVISAHILRVSNSVFFASLNRRINSIKDAIVRVGFNETKRIVMSMSVMTLFAKEDKNIGFNRIDFWYHSLSVGILAGMIAKRMGNTNTEEAFLAGLLHDFGIIIMDEFFPTIFSRALETTTDKACEFIDAEKEIMGITHNDVVGSLFPQWKLPDTITEGVTKQYDFHTFHDGLDNPGQKIAFCVGAANVIAKALYLGRECDQFIRPVDNWVFQQCRMATGMTDQILEDVYKQITLFRQFLDLDEREYPHAYPGVQNAEQRRIGIVNIGKDIFVPPVHYLPKEGFTVETIDPRKPAREYDQNFDVIIAWTRGNTSDETVGPYCRIVKRYEGALPDGEKPEFTPAIVFCDRNSPLAKQKASGNVAYTPNLFDIRELDARLMEILSPSGAETKAAGAQSESQVSDSAVACG